MYFQYGSFRSDFAECTLSVRKENVIESNVPVSQKVTWTIQGRRHGTNTSNLVTRGRILEAVFNQHGRDAKLLDENFSAVLQLLNATSINGVRVVQPPHYPDLTGAQLTTWFDWTAVLEAEYPLTASQFTLSGQLLEWSETVTVIGSGGPRHVVIETLNTAPVVQIVNARTKVTVLQSGNALAYGRYPTPPVPYFGFEQQSQRQIAMVNTQRNSNRFGATWSYTFESPHPIGGPPR